MSVIAVIASLSKEASIVASAMENIVEEEYAGLLFQGGSIGRNDVVLTVCGVGKVNGARTAQALIDRYRPSAMLHTGVAGSLSPEAGHLSLVISTDLTYHDADRNWLLDCPPHIAFFPADADLRDALSKAALPVGGALAGRMVTGDVFVQSASQNADIHARCGGLCVDMEVAATAHVACLNHVPYCAIKCISDMADDGADGTFEDFVHIAADKAAGTVVRAIRSL